VRQPNLRQQFDRQCTLHFPGCTACNKSKMKVSPLAGNDKFMKWFQKNREEPTFDQAWRTLEL
jgi:hypothetical protein